MGPSTHLEKFHYRSVDSIITQCQKQKHEAEAELTQRTPKLLSHMLVPPRWFSISSSSEFILVFTPSEFLPFSLLTQRKQHENIHRRYGPSRSLVPIEIWLPFIHPRLSSNFL